MNHLSEEQIVLHYYGDAEEVAEVERHLAACPECRAEFARVQSMLQQIDRLEVPEPAAALKKRPGSTCGPLAGKGRIFSATSWGRNKNGRSPQ